MLIPFWSVPNIPKGPAYECFLETSLTLADLDGADKDTLSLENHKWP